MYIYIYIYICINIHTYIHTYIHIHTKCRPVALQPPTPGVSKQPSYCTFSTCERISIAVSFFSTHSRCLTHRLSSTASSSRAILISRPSLLFNPPSPTLALPSPSALPCLAILASVVARS